MKKILVIGATGFIGKHLVKKLSEEIYNHSIRSNITPELLIQNFVGAVQGLLTEHELAPAKAEYEIIKAKICEKVRERIEKLEKKLLTN